MKVPVQLHIRWALLFAWIALSLFLFYRIYDDAKDRTLESLNSMQMLRARQAAKGIEDSIAAWIALLRSAAESPHLIDLDDYGKDRMAFILGAFREDIRAVTRVDERGRIVYTLPENPKAIGADISSQSHVQEIFQRRAPVVSDIFTAVQGYPAIAVHVPVISGQVFRGTLAVLLDFSEIARRFLDVIRTSTSGTVHLITAQGIVIYSSLRDHEKKSVFKNGKNSSSFEAMVREMVLGKAGSATFETDGKNRMEKHHGVYLPIHLAETFWSLAVTTNEKEALRVLESLQVRLVLFIGILFSGGIFLAYFAMKAWGVIREEQKRKEAEKQLLFERAQLLSILDSIDATIYVADLKTYEVLFLNRHMKALFGEGAVGKSCFRIFRGESEPCPHCTNDRLLDDEGNPTGVQIWEGQNPITQKWYINYDRAIRWIDGRMVRLQVASDITRRKQMEEILRASEEKYRSVLEANPDPVVVYDMEGRVVYFNPAFTRVFGWSLEERIGKKLDDFVPEEAWPETRSLIEKVLAGNHFSGVETVRFNQNGKKIPVSLSGAFTRGEDGKIINSIINIRDISEEKKIKEQLQQAMKMEAIGTLSGGIAHEFNNILAIILGNTELAIDDVPEWTPARHHLEETQSACLRAREVVRQLLSFSRKSEVKKRAVPMAPLIKESLRLLRASIPTFIEIRTRIDEDIGAILGDPTQIHQVLINLCTNARDAMKEDGGILEIGLKYLAVEGPDPTPYPRLRPGRYVVLTVKDTGKGIDPNDIDRVFDPFFTTKEVGQGTGMGLAVVHGIVKAHDGFIYVDSEKGKGTRLTLLFPVVEEVPDEELLPLEKVMKGNESVLFVDDEELLEELGYQILEKLGYRVKSTTDPLKALEWFRSDPTAFDLVITDMAMPKMPGDRLAQTLLDIRPDIPILLCTGYSERTSKEQLKKMGIQGVIMKPIEIAKLSIAIRSTLDTKTG